MPINFSVCSNWKKNNNMFQDKDYSIMGKIL